jgi:hypothetical protein
LLLGLHHDYEDHAEVADDLKTRAEWTEEFFRAAFARPDFVNCHYCGLIDGSLLVPRKASSVVYDGEWNDSSDSPSESDASWQDLDESRAATFQDDFDQRPAPE